MMKNPPHPGEILREDVVKELGLTVTEAAEALGMSRTALSRIMNGHAAITANLALRLEAAGVSTARVWLSMQAAYDLSQARRRKQPAVRIFSKAVHAHASKVAHS